MGQKFEKKNLTVSKTVAQCRKYPIPYLYTLSQTIPYLFTLNRTIPYLNTLSRTIPYLNTLSRTIPYLKTLSRTIPYLNTLKKPKFSPKPNSCPQPIRIEHQKTLKPRQPIRIGYHSAEKNPNALGSGGRPFSALGSSRLAIAYLNTWRVYHPPPPPPDQLTLLLLMSDLNLLAELVVCSGSAINQNGNSFSVNISNG